MRHGGIYMKLSKVTVAIFALASATGTELLEAHPPRRCRPQYPQHNVSPQYRQYYDAGIRTRDWLEQKTGFSTEQIAKCAVGACMIAGAAYLAITNPGGRNSRSLSVNVNFNPLHWLGVNLNQRFNF